MRAAVFGAWLRPQVAVQVRWWALRARLALAWRLFLNIVGKET